MTMTKVLVGFIKLLSRIPLGLLYIVANFISKILFRIIPYRKKVIDMNLEMAFPEKSKKERKKIRNSFYSFFTNVLIEGFKQLTISPEDLKRRMKYSGFEKIDEHIKNGRSVMLISFHYSNWEWGFVGYSAAAEYPLDGIYQPMKSEGFGDMVVESRSRFGATMIPMEDTYEAMQEGIENKPFVIGLIPDQSPVPFKGFWMEFLGRGTPVFRGPENLAKKFNLPVYYVDINPIKQGFYSAEVKLITENPLECESGWISEQYMKHLEDKIKARPANYLWSHKRWKHTIPKDLAEKMISKNFPPPEEDKLHY